MLDTETQDPGLAVPVDEAAATILIRTRSPAFTTRPPALENEALIPPSVRQVCAAWERGRFEPRDLVIRVLRDVYVAAEGLVFDRDGMLLRSTAQQHEPELVQHAARTVRDAIAGAPGEHHDEPLVLGKKRGAGNYGHWMIEMLPMIHLALARLSDPAIGVLLHDVADPQLGSMMMQTLRRLGIADQRIRVSGMAPVRVRELIVVQGLTEHGGYMSPLVQECHERLASGIVGAGHARVFLRRGAGMTRQFADEAHISRLAVERGYTVLSPADLTLEQQIALMRDARLIAGVMGSAMTNLVYASAGARATLFAPATMPDTFFWFIANLRGLHYREIRCAQSGAGDGWNRPLDLSFRAFRRVLDEDVAAV